MKQFEMEMFSDIMNDTSIDEDFKTIRQQIQKAMDASPNVVKYEDALKQVNNYEKQSNRIF